MRVFSFFITWDDWAATRASAARKRNLSEMNQSLNFLVQLVISSPRLFNINYWRDGHPVGTMPKRSRILVTCIPSYIGRSRETDDQHFHCFINDALMT